MKKIVTIILSLALMIPTTTAFADERTELTFEDLNQISEKYGIKPVVLDSNADIPTEMVLKNLTKEELEEIIVKAQNEVQAPLVFEDTIAINEISNENSVSLYIDEDNQMSNMMATRALGWDLINKTATLSKTSYFGQVKELEFYSAVAASYQYENCTLPGERGKKRNWKFTSCDNGTLLHLNKGVYEINSVSSQASPNSSGNMITQTYNGTYNIGVYVQISGIPVRIPGPNNSFSGTINYSITEVQ